MKSFVHERHVSKTAHPLLVIKKPPGRMRKLIFRVFLFVFFKGKKEKWNCMLPIVKVNCFSFSYWFRFMSAWRSKITITVVTMRNASSSIHVRHVALPPTTQTNPPSQTVLLISPWKLIFSSRGSAAFLWFKSCVTHGQLAGELDLLCLDSVEEIQFSSVQFY